jgi:hypothetical protein
MEKKYILFNFIHNRPLIVILYTEQPVPWTRVLLYGFKKNETAVRVLYNSTFYIPYHGLKCAVHSASNYLIQSCRRLALGILFTHCWNCMIFRKERLLARQNFLVKRNVFAYRVVRNLHFTQKTWRILFSPAILHNIQYSSLSFTVYTGVRRYKKGGKFELELLAKHSNIIPNSIGYMFLCF